jgi:hypothetical protein
MLTDSGTFFVIPNYQRFRGTATTWVVCRGSWFYRCVNTESKSREGEKSTILGYYEPYWQKTLERTDNGETKVQVKIWDTHDSGDDHEGDFAVISVSLKLEDETVWSTEWKHLIG